MYIATTMFLRMNKRRNSSSSDKTSRDNTSKDRSSKLRDTNSRPLSSKMEVEVWKWLLCCYLNPASFECCIIVVSVVNIDVLVPKIFSEF